VKTLEYIIGLQQKIVPEMSSLAEKRYELLTYIRYHQPIGRRALATQMNLSESAVRTDIKVLKDAGLVELSGLGVTATQEGWKAVDQLREYVKILHGFLVTERYLEKELGVNMVKIVPGDSTSDGCVFKELGRAAAEVLAEVLKDKMVVAVSGGSTMASVAAAVSGYLPDTLIVPTRGGLGENVERQANSVAAVMARNLGGQYRLLHIPEGLNDEALEAIKNTDSTVSEIEELIQKADVMIHSIGRADVMAHRRTHAPKVAENICKLGVGEALGHYFSQDGKCIYTYSTNGFRLNNLVGVGRTIAVAGGVNKAEAILAVIRAGSNDVLVIDEAAAGAIQLIIKAEKSQKTF
jgi:central glycolytic genes regulator